MKSLKLYVWNNVFVDYTAGIAFALASSVDEAKYLIANKMGITESGKESIIRELTEPPEVYEVTTPYGNGVYGGG